MRRLSFVCIAVVWAAAVILRAAPAAAQQPGQPSSGRAISGFVVDTSGGVIPGANVTLKSGNGERRGLTDAGGHFVFDNVPTGAATLTVLYDGFEPVTVNVSGPRQDLRVVLTLTSVVQAITVHAPAATTVHSRTATKTDMPLRDVPQSVTVITHELMQEQLMMSVADVVRYVPGITAHQGENNRDQIIVRGNNTSADFFVDGVRDDVQYFRDVYNVERVEALKGPNAMIFGRGGAGGVLNRVLKRADFQPVREVSVQGGMFGNKRLTADLGQPLSGAVAVRLNGVLEHSDSFRSAVGLERYGVTPTVTIVPSAATSIVLNYELLHDTRTADRGITSYRGAPAAVDSSLFYGNPDDSDVRLRVNLGSAAIEHHRGNATLRNRTVIAGYDRFYQNFVPGVASQDQTLVALTAYNNSTQRTNVFNQTDLVYSAGTGRIRHSLLIGGELGRQFTDNFRRTGFFNNTATSLNVPFLNPTISTPVTFRQNATDNDNHLRATVAAAYAQDQVTLSKHVELLGGLRFDRFDLQYHNNRTGDTLSRPDNLVSPRAGIVIKPITPVSLYGSYSVSFLPSSGDQFASLTTITQQMRPERFNNYEVGLKWDLIPNLALTTAVYRLDRTNTRSTDPNDPTRIVQTGSQRTNGYELGVNGAVTHEWTVAGGYAYQNAFVTSATTAAIAGAQAAQVPRHTLSVWNHYKVHPRLAGGLGVVYRSDMFAAIDDSVTLPGYTRIDAAAFVFLTKRARLQANIENLFDKTYFANADNNTNISPGFPRTLRVALTTHF